MPESDRVARLRAGYQAFNRGDFDGLLDLMDPDIEWHPPASSPEPQPLQGREAVLEYLKPNLFESQTAEPFEVIEREDRIMVGAQVHARGAESGLQAEVTSFHIWTIANERVVRFEVYEERERALAALRGEA